MKEPSSEMLNRLVERSFLNADVRRRGIYVLPNLCTTAALFSGFFAIVQAMNGAFETSAIAIFVAMIFDGLDGRIARLTRTQSAFGAEYDSLSDMVSFGVAPALIVYVWMLSDLGKLGWAGAFIYCVGAALRLARFNTQVGVADHRYFQGLPSPAAAALVAGFVWVMNVYGIDRLPTNALRWTTWGVTVFAGLTMVSNIRYWSGKDVNLRRQVSFSKTVVLALLLVGLSLVATNLPEMIFGVLVLYVLSGYFFAIARCVQRKLPKKRCDN